MIILLDTSTALCRLTLVSDDDEHHTYEWEAGRELARGLHAFLRDRLAEHGQEFADIAGIGAMKGPGSFTGLRIGLTVLNTLADTLHIPIVGVEMSDTWQDKALGRLASGESDRIVLPYYGREAIITQPRK